MEQKIRRISFSEYSTYMSCQHKWYLLYHLKYPGEESEELLFGSTLHSTIENILINKHIQRLYKLNKDDTIKSIFKGFLQEKLLKIKDENFLLRFKDSKLASIFMWQALKVISSLDILNRFKDYEVVAVEYKLDGLTIYETEEVKITYKGFIDLIFRHKVSGKYLILDWKTSRKAWDIDKKMKDNEDFFAQLCLYKKFYSQVENIPFESVETKFYNLPREQPELQSPYVGVLRQEYVDHFFGKFLNTAIEIFKHSESLKDFFKAKHVTKKNFCYRCPFNKLDTCNDHDEFQTVEHPIVIIPAIEEKKDIVPEED